MRENLKDRKFVVDGQTWQVTKDEDGEEVFASKVNAEGKKQKGRPRKFAVANVLANLQ